MGEPGKMERRLDARQAPARSVRKSVAVWRILAKIFANPDLPEIDDYYEPFDLRLPAPAYRRRHPSTSR
jgi:nitrate reductase beta subunit